MTKAARACCDGTAVKPQTRCGGRGPSTYVSEQGLLPEGPHQAFGVHLPQPEHVEGPPVCGRKAVITRGAVGGRPKGTSFKPCPTEQQLLCVQEPPLSSQKWQKGNESRRQSSSAGGGRGVPLGTGLGSSFTPGAEQSSAQQQAASPTDSLPVSSPGWSSLHRLPTTHRQGLRKPASFPPAREPGN